MFFLLFLLYACTPSGHNRSFTTEPQVNFDLEAIRERGSLVALLDNNSISYFIYKGQPMGYEYELLRDMAKSLKVDLKIRLVTGIEQAIDLLNKGEGDVLAFPLTITAERKQYVTFTNPHFDTHQVLVQKKPANWRMQAPEMLEKKLIRQPEQLGGQEVYVMKGSAFLDRLRELNTQLQKPILIKEDSATAETESLIQKVATGEIKFTVTDEVIANTNTLYYSNLDIKTVLSEPQQIAWAVRTKIGRAHV